LVKRNLLFQESPLAPGLLEVIGEMLKWNPARRPSALKAYVMPVLLLNFVLFSWAIISVHVVHGWSIYLGYAVIVTLSLRLYLAYLDHYLN